MHFPSHESRGDLMYYIAEVGRSALLFGVIGMIVIAPLTLLGFYSLGVKQVDPVVYAIFKGIWAGLMAGMLVVPMVLVALRPPSHQQTNSKG